jgi:drug/metabolite transporter (DMT)-like permease
VLAVVGVALYSGWKLIRRQSSVAGIQTINLLWANVLILAGDLLNAAAGSLARFFGLQSSFWIIQAFGWTVFFAGVLIASHRPATQTSPEKAKMPG